MISSHTRRWVFGTLRFFKGSKGNIQDGWKITNIYINHNLYLILIYICIYIYNIVIWRFPIHGGTPSYHPFWGFYMKSTSYWGSQPWRGLVPSNYIVTVVGTPQIGNGPREVFTRFAALERVNFAAIYCFEEEESNKKSHLSLSLKQIYLVGWWFGTFGLFFHLVGDVIIPSDEFHHFSEG